MAATSPPDSPYIVSPLSSDESSMSADIPSVPSSSQWTGPGIFVKMDIGVNFTPNMSKRFSFGYASRNIDESVMAPHPPSFSASTTNYNATQGTASGASARTIRRGIRSRSALQLRTSPVSPLSSSSASSSDPSHQEHQRDYRSSPGTPSTVHVAYGYRSSPAHGQNGAGPKPQLQYGAVRQTTIDRRPLPPLPSYRLGQDLPWTSPTTTWTVSPDDCESGRGVTDVAVAAFTPPPRTAREDPQRTRELAELHEAMMAVDLGNDVWHPGGTWSQRPSRGPRDLGWAVAVPTGGDEQQARTTTRGHNGANDSRPEAETPAEDDPPPAYTAGQWGSDWEWEERGRYWVRGRPRHRSMQYYYA